MQLLSEQITEKLVELVRPHVFIYDVKSDKQRDGQCLQNIRESICMEMGVDGMDGKCSFNHARVRAKEFKPNQGQWKTFNLGLGIDPKKEVSFNPTAILFFGLKMKQNKINKFITENFENNNIILIISVVGHNFFV